MPMRNDSSPTIGSADDAGALHMRHQRDEPDAPRMAQRARSAMTDDEAEEPEMRRGGVAATRWSRAPRAASPSSSASGRRGGGAARPGSSRPGAAAARDRARDSRSSPALPPRRQRALQPQHQPRARPCRAPRCRRDRCRTRRAARQAKRRELAVERGRARRCSHSPPARSTSASPPPCRLDPALLGHRSPLYDSAARREMPLSRRSRVG